MARLVESPMATYSTLTMGTYMHANWSIIESGFAKSRGFILRLQRCGIFHVGDLRPGMWDVVFVLRGTLWSDIPVRNHGTSLPRLARRKKRRCGRDLSS